MGLRGDAIAQFDWSVGQLLEALDKMGLTQNTLIILSSDNGPVVDDGYDDKAEELLNGHEPAGNLRGGKYSAFEGGTRVPVIVHWPKAINKPEVSDVLISQIDWLASLASLVDARIPKGSAPDSYNRLANLLGQDKQTAHGLLNRHPITPYPCVLKIGNLLKAAMVLNDSLGAKN